MISTNFNGVAVFIINDAWNGKTEFQLAAKFSRGEAQSLTQRSARRPYAQTILCDVKYPVTLQDADVRAVIGALRSLNTQPVIIPFWPAMSTWANRNAAAVNGGLRLAFKADWSQYALYASTDPEPGWPEAGDLFCPALMGFIKPSQPKMLSPDAATWDIDCTELSPEIYALSLTAAAPAAGPQPAGYTAAPPLLPLQPDFTGINEDVTVVVKREQIAFSRQQSTTFYPQNPMRQQLASYTLTDADVWTMLTFFVNSMGPGASFWASTWLEAAKLTANALATDTVLQVQDTNGVRVGDYLSLYAGTGPVATALIQALDPVANTITLTAPIGVALNASITLINQLCLVRLVKPSISMTWKRPGAAKCELQWEELPPEYAPPADETLGVTLGQLKTRVVLIQFTRTLVNGTVTNYYATSYEHDLNYGGQNWVSDNQFNGGSKSAWDIGDISQSLNLEDDSVTITSFLWAGNPLIPDLLKLAEAPLIVTIIFADYDGVTVSNAQTVFTGDCSAPSRDGNKISMKCKMGPSVLGSLLPVFLRGVMCAHLRGSNADGTNLISVGCTGPDSIMLKANWKLTAVVAGPVSAAFPFTLNLNTLTGVGANAIAALTAAAVFANWFANGVITWNAGANIQTRMMIGSTAPAGGVLAVTLHRYFSAVPNIGDVVTLYPGCDGLMTTCKAYDAALNPTGKFNNYPNFGGEPFTPIANPSTSGLSRLGTQGGKK